MVTLTLPAVTANVCDVDPCGMKTDAGTPPADGFDEESATVIPPAPAAAVSVTVPVPDPPAVIEPGNTETLLRDVAGGFTFKLNVALTAEEEAVSVTGVDVVTLPVVTENVCEVAPWGTFTDRGTPAAVGLELERETAMPPIPAGAVRVTVPVPVWPLMIGLGLAETLLSAGRGVTVTPNVTLTPE